MSFIQFARTHGLEIDPARFGPGERIRRCGTVDHPRTKNGAYFWDGHRGWVFNWEAEARAQWFNDPDSKPWTEAEKAAWHAKRQAAQHSVEEGHRRASMRAAEMLRSAQPGPHNYLHLKGFPDMTGLVAADGSLLIPMRNLQSGDLQGLQQVRWIEADRRYKKKMLPGMRAKGAVFRLGDKAAPETFLCEGYSTGLSILAALRSVGLRASVLVCFSAGNLVHVAPLLKGRAFVFADHDSSGTGERAAQQTGLPYCMAATVGMDANDLHASAGLMAVCKELMAVRRQGVSAMT